MNKILTGITGLLVVLGLVAGSAFALFSSTVSVTGLAINTASAVLEISTDNSTFESTLDFGNTVLTTLLPGESDEGDFYLRNTSDDENLELGLTAELISASGDWGSLNTVISCAVYEDGFTVDDATHSTNYLTLATWNSGPVSLTGGPLASGDTRQYWINCKLDENADNSVSGKSLTDVSFDIVGTQVE